MMDDKVSQLVKAAKKGKLEEVTVLIEQDVQINSADKRNRTAAFAASAKGHINILKYLTTKGADLHIKCGKYNTSCLSVAAQFGSVEVAEYLLAHGIEIDVTNKYGVSPLMFAALNNHSDMVKYLLDNNADEHKLNTSGSTALHCSAQEGSIQSAELLLEKGVNIDTPNNEGTSPLMLAALNNHSDMVKFLLENNSNVHKLDTEGRTALYCSAQGGSIKCAELILEKGTNIDSTTNGGDTPVMTAALRNHIDLVKWFLVKGVDVHQRDTFGRTLLHLLCRAGSLECTQMVLQKGLEIDARENEGQPSAKRTSLANVKYTCDISGNTCLTKASLSGNTELIQWLIEQGLDTNHHIKEPLSEKYVNAYRREKEVIRKLEQDSVLFPESLEISSKGCTPVTLAAIEGHLPAIQLLHENGADIHRVCDLIGITAFMVCCIGDHEEAVDWFLKEDVTVNHQTYAGYTGLHVCAMTGNAKLTKCLLKNGADSNTRTKKGMTALMLASDNGHSEVVELLRNSGSSSEEHKSDQDMIEEISSVEPQMRKWSDQERKTLVNSCHVNAIFIGETESGKSSLARSLVHNTQYRADIDDRTVVVSHLQMRLQNNQVINIQDLGGHSSYRHTAPFYISDSPYNLIHVCHDITSTKYNVAYAWFHEAICRAPTSQFCFILTKIDKVNKGNKRSKLKQVFINELESFMSQEIETLEVKLEMCKSKTQKSDVEKLLQRYTTLKNELPNLVHTTTTLTGGYFTTSTLKEMLIKFSDEAAKSNQIPQIYPEFFSEIGKIRMKTDGVKKQGIPKNPESQLPTVSNESNVSDQAHRMDSHGTKMMADNIDNDVSTDFTTKNLSEIHTSESNQENGINQPVQHDYLLPKQQQDTTTDEQKKLYISYNEAKEIFETLETKLYQKTSEEGSFRSCLSYFHTLGFLKWFQGDEELESKIFHNLDTFQNMIKSVFHHDNESKLEFNCLDAHHKALFSNKEHIFRKEYSVLRKEGIMSQAILKSLLHVNGCVMDDTTVSKILAKLGVAYSFSSSDKTFHFIPFFIDDKPIPREILKIKDDLKICTDEEIAFELILQGNIPKVYYSHIVVQFLSHLHVTSPTQHQDTWGHGFYATVGPIKLLFDYDGRKVIEIVIKGKPKNLPKMWIYLKDIEEKSKDLQQEFLHGAITALLFKCLHCKLYNVTSVHVWDLEVLLQIPKESYKDRCACEKTDPLTNFPGAFVHPVTEDDKSAIEDVSNYLKTAFQYKPRERDIVLQTWINRAMQTMHVAPVLTKLIANQAITLAEKSQLALVHDARKVETIVDKLVIPRDEANLQKFKESLLGTKFYTNITLAKSIPTSDMVEKEDQFDDAYLTDEEYTVLTSKFYEPFLEHVSVDDLIIQLFKNYTIDTDQFEEIRNTQGKRKRATFLLDYVLLRGTYETVVKFHTALMNTNNENNEYLAKKLPLRKKASLQ